MDKKLKITNTDFKNLYILEPNIFSDERGSFGRVFCSNELSEIFGEKIVQINHSVTSKKGSFRGLHFQYPPYSEIKMVKCIKGSILDIVVDIRENSPTFLKYFTIELSSKNQKMIYIPRGFAHGFQTLEDDCELLYLHSKEYIAQSEGALNIKDPILNIALPLEISNISQRDLEHKFLQEQFKGLNIDEM